MTKTRTMKAFKLTFNDEGFYIDTSLENISTVISNTETEEGDEFIIDVIEMTEDELNNLPEFDGF